MMPRCAHPDGVRGVTPSADGREDCLRTGNAWVRLRLCESCGHAGPPRLPKKKHATKHFHATGHPVVKSFGLGEEWGWGYEGEMFCESL